MNHRACVLLLFFILSILSYAQNTTNIWYFGVNAGLDFNSGSPVPLTNGQVNSSEGSASIADNSGNLLFYTDGIDIWNRNHVPMPNGSGLLGNWDATQAGVIVQKPGSTNLYYVFAVDDGAGPDGITYSEVDMNLALGLGNVTATKNVLLTTPSTEKLTAVRHCNKKDIWIITHDWNSDAFRTFLFTSTGINPVPILSNVGAVHTGPDWNTNGYLKASPDGSKLALAVCHGMNIFELFDFNNSTGVVSNVVPLSSVASTYGAYGVEFSPDGTKLYGTTILPGRLLQFDLCAGSASAINNSRVIIDSTIFWLGALQLGPDKKIYVSRYADSIGVINFPNIAGIGCNYIEASVFLNGGSGVLGLPNFVTSFFDPPLAINSATLSCLTDSFSILKNNCLHPYSLDSISWSFGDAASGSTNISSLTNPVHNFSSAGSYTISVILNYPCNADTFYQQINIQSFTGVSSVSSNVLCFGDSTGAGSASMVSGGTSPYQYSWSPYGGTTQTATGLNAGTYTIVITDSLNCTNTSTITITEPSLLQALTTSSLTICSGTNLSLSAGATGGNPQYNFFWSPSAGVSSTTGATVNFNSTNNSIYTITVTDANGCTDSSQISIGILAIPQVIITGDTIICTGDNTILSGSGNGSYNWSNGTTSTAINVSPAISTPYSLTVTSNGCSNTANISVTISLANVNTGPDKSIVKGNSQLLHAFGTGKFLWNTGDTSQNILVSPTITTTYCVYIENNIGCHDTDCVTITVEDPCGFVLVPSAFSPNGDGQNDELKLIGSCVKELKFTIFNRWGEKVFEARNILMSWNGTYRSQELNTDVFVYTLDAIFENGEEISENGNIHLIK